MVTFRVVKEQHGWAVRMGESMSTPFWSRRLAIREAGGMAAGIRCHGVIAEVLIEDAASYEAIAPESASGASGRLKAAQ